MTTPKISKAPRRKGAKQYTLVTFALDGWDGEFSLPKLDQMPVGVIGALNNGDLFKLIDFLTKNAPESAEAIEDFSGDELESLLTAWSDASGADLGKSEA